MTLSDLPDQTLNTLCCKALGWKKSWQPYDGAGWDDKEGRIFTGHLPNFCSSLDLIQQYLVPHLQTKGAKKIDTYMQEINKQLFPEEYSSLSVPTLWFFVHTVPARVRVVAFLTALGAEVQK